MDIQRRIKRIEAATGQPGGIFLIEKDGRIFSGGQEYTREQFENIKKHKQNIVVIVDNLPD